MDHQTPHNEPQLTGYVLAGGRSTRMGTDKALLETSGKPLVAQALTTLHAVCSTANILSGPPNPERDAILSCYAHLVPDALPNHAGPLAALAAALHHCLTPYALLLAVDQPQIPPALLARLIAIATEADAALACFSIGDRPEPLPMLVARDLRAGLPAVLASGERRLLPGAERCAATLGRAVLHVPVGPDEAAAFHNLNTPADLEHWQHGRFPSNHSAPEAS